MPGTACARLRRARDRYRRAAAGAAWLGRTPIDLSTASFHLLPLPSPSGIADHVVVVPNQPALVGMQPWFHAAILDGSGIRLINAVRETITP